MSHIYNISNNLAGSKNLSLIHLKVDTQMLFNIEKYDYRK